MNFSQLQIALWTLVRKEVRRFLRIWPQTLLPPAITMSLYFVIFGNLVGSRIGQMGGVSYMQFIVPGLIMMAVITNSYANVSSSFFSVKFQKSIEELIMTDLFIHNWFVTIYTVLITSVLFSLGGFINAVYAKSFDDISIIPTFVLTPLTYLGGVFYAISALGPFWQKLSLINPIVYMVNAFRFGILGHSDVNVTFSLIIVTLCCAVLYGIAYYLLARGSGMRE